MAKKRKVSKRNTETSFEDKLFNFALGVIVFFIIEAVFMLGGLFLESKMSTPATGIPSFLGLVVWLVLSCFYKNKREFILGGLTISILVPIILIIVTITKFVPFSDLMYYSIIGFIIVLIGSLFWMRNKK